MSEVVGAPPVAAATAVKADSLFIPSQDPEQFVVQVTITQTPFK